MPIHIEPPEDQDALLERVAASLAATFGDALTMSTPYRVESADLEALAGGKLVLHFGQRWQCLVGDEEPEAAVDVILEADGYAVVSVNHGRLATRLNDAVRVAEELLGDGDYALTSIEIPALHTAVVRLVEATREREVFIPVLPLSSEASGLEPMSLYSGAELVSALREEAASAVQARWE